MKIYITTNTSLGAKCKSWAIRNIPNDYQITDNLDDSDIFFKKEYPSTNGLCTVLYKKESIDRLHADLHDNPIVKQAFDWEMNDRFKKLGFEVYWAKAITRHGSVVAARSGQFQGLKSMLR